VVPAERGVGRDLEEVDNRWMVPRLPALDSKTVPMLSSSHPTSSFPEHASASYPSSQNGNVDGPGIALCSGLSVLAAGSNRAAFQPAPARGVQLARYTPTKSIPFRARLRRVTPSITRRSRSDFMFAVLSSTQSRISSLVACMQVGGYVLSTDIYSFDYGSTGAIHSVLCDHTRLRSCFHIRRSGSFTRSSAQRRLTLTDR
jgi:hypothetical protein